MVCYLPHQLIVKAVVEIYHRDFWELWELVKDGSDPACLRQYLALLSNLPLRKAVFGV